MSYRRASNSYRKRKSRILYQVTFLIVLVLTATGVATFFIASNSEERLINKSIDRLVITEAENIYSSYDYIIEILYPVYLEKCLKFSFEELAKAYKESRITELQETVNKQLKTMVETGLLGLRYNLFIFVTSPLSPDNTLYCSSDPSLIFNWQVPDYISNAIKIGTPYIYMERGCPELGLQDECLIVIKKFAVPGFDFVSGFVGVKTMHDEISSIKEFYNDNKKRTNIYLALIILASILVVVLITFFILSYLIRKRITQPIEELSATAKRVMGGDLDVEIEVRKGEEFEHLKLAFREMVERWRDLVERSTKGD